MKKDPTAIELITDYRNSLVELPDPWRRIRIRIMSERYDDGLGIFEGEVPSSLVDQRICLGCEDRHYGQIGQKFCSANCNRLWNRMTGRSSHRTKKPATKPCKENCGRMITGVGQLKYCDHCRLRVKSRKTVEAERMRKSERASHR